jgi:hypothetical protein
MVLRYAHFAPGHLALAAAKIRPKPRTKSVTLKKAATGKSRKIRRKWW